MPEASRKEVHLWDVLRQMPRELIWKTGSGNSVPIVLLTNSHLKNILRMMQEPSWTHREQLPVLQQEAERRGLPVTYRKQRRLTWRTR